MLDPSIALTGRSLEGGLRAGSMIGGAISQGMSKNALQEAQARINAGEDYNTVMQQLMAKDPAAAQQLMNLKQGSQQIDAQAQEMDALKQRYGMQKLQTAAMPMLGAIMQDDPKVQDKLIDEASSIFKGQSDGVFESLQGIKGLQGEQKINALTGLVKTMRASGIFPEDPSQMMQGGTALGQNLSLYDQAVAAGDMERAELIKRNIDPYSGSFARGAGAGEARLSMEQGLNPILNARKAGDIQAAEQTATGQAELVQKQQEVAKGERELSEAKRSKDNAAAAINEQLQQIDRLGKHPGFASAVGMSSIAPSMRGSDAYGFEKQLEKLDAQSFMAMIPNLAGMGALSNAEGAKVSAALSALNTGLSEEEFKAEMETIKQTLTKARERLRTGEKATEPTAEKASSIGRFKIEVE
jgi:hypothetical protein